MHFSCDVRFARWQFLRGRTAACVEKSWLAVLFVIKWGFNAVLPRQGARFSGIAPHKFIGGTRNSPRGVRVNILLLAGENMRNLDLVAQQKKTISDMSKMIYIAIL